MMNNKAVVFVHGLVRPSFKIGGSFEYFRDLKSTLADQPILSYFPDLPSAASIEERSKPLKLAIAAIDADEIYLLGHSMGGLDCRYYAANNPTDQRIKRLITIATPHQGSPLADWVLKNRSPLATMLRHVFSNGAQALTTTACKVFNKNTPNREDIEYFSYAASRPYWELPAWLRVLAKHIGDEANDGLIPVSSANWGQFVGLIHADHFETSGWSLALSNQAKQRPFDHIDFYRRLINELITTIE